MKIKLKGPASTSAAQAVIGAGTAMGKITLKWVIFDEATGENVASKEKTLYDVVAVGIPFESEPVYWSDNTITISFSVYLEAGHSYHFRAAIYSFHRAGAAALGCAKSESEVTATLQEVSII